MIEPSMGDRRELGRALAIDVLDAYGGDASVRGIESISAWVTAGGPVFALKGQPRALHAIRFDCEVARQYGRVTGRYPRPWDYRFDPVRLVADMTRLSRWPRRWPWEPEDAGAFAASALWTYLLLPFHLLDADLGLERLPDRHGHRRLMVSFPAQIATHSREQTLHIDEFGGVSRLDYVARILGTWARPAHLVRDRRVLDGLSIGCDRVVVPKLFGHPMPFLPLVRIQVHDVRINALEE